jgi:hypothetical protein
LNYLVYKTTNLKNNKYYIGVHKQDSDVFDGYYGSSTALKKDISTLGKTYFKRETLYSFKKEGDAYEKESQIVDKNFISDPLTYNVQLGGKGGFHGCNTPEATAKSLKSVQELMKKRYNGDPAGQLHTPESYSKIRETRKKNSMKKFPELNWEVKVVDTQGNKIWEGILVDILIELFGSEQGVSRRNRVAPRIGTYTIDYRTKPEWKDYLIMFND